jgi:hypothetical protein
MLLYGAMAGRLGLALAAGAAAAAVFVGWEATLWAEYGQSHFLGSLGGASGGAFKVARLRQLTYGLFANGGPVAAALIPAAIYALHGRRAAIGALVATAGALAAIVAGYDAWPALVVPGLQPERVPTLATVSALLGMVLTVVLVHLVARQLRAGDRLDAFLAGWLAIEAVAYFVLSPFPAARRIMGLAAVATLIVLREIARRAPAGVGAGAAAMPRAIAALAVVLGIGAWALGFVDAVNTRLTAQQAAARAIAAAGPGRAWIWGYLAAEQHAIEAGLTQVVLNESVLRAGDVVVVMPAGIETLFDWDLHAFVPMGELAAGINAGVRISPEYFYGQLPIAAAADTRPRAVLYRVTAAGPITRGGPAR